MWLVDMKEEMLQKVVELRRELHAHAELSMQEVETMELLIRFIEEHTTLEVVRRDGWFYVFFDQKAEESIAFRADMDAIVHPDGYPFHGCGHDGHSATLAGLALELEELKRQGEQLPYNVYLIFQPGEEIGAGAKICSELIREKKINRIFGYHNIPGHTLGKVLFRKDVFACASMGMTIRLQGKQTHAAYPEDGINPGFLIGELLNKVPALLDGIKEKGMVLLSLIEVKVGEKNFGISAGSGEVSFTIRAHYQDALELLKKEIESFVRSKAEEKGIQVSFEYADVFPDTVNQKTLVEQIERLCQNSEIDYTYLEEPMRWSEDFGWYEKLCDGCFFGIGTGEDMPQLHTPEYEYNDRLLKKAVGIFTNITKNLDSY